MHGARHSFPSDRLLCGHTHAELFGCGWCESCKLADVGGSAPFLSCMWRNGGIGSTRISPGMHIFPAIQALPSLRTHDSCARQTPFVDARRFSALRSHANEPHRRRGNYACVRMAEVNERRKRSAVWRSGCRTNRMQRAEYAAVSKCTRAGLSEDFECNEGNLRPLQSVRSSCATETASRAGRERTSAIRTNIISDCCESLSAFGVAAGIFSSSGRRAPYHGPRMQSSTSLLAELEVFPSHRRAVQAFSMALATWLREQRTAQWSDWSRPE